MPVEGFVTAGSLPEDRVEGPLLALDGLSVAFGGVAALSDVSTEIHKGEIVALVGPNGAGKTTLLNAVNGFLKRVLRGRVVLAGQEISNLSQSSIARRGVTRSFQEPRLIEEDSARENVLCGTHQLIVRGALRQLVSPRAYGREEARAKATAEQILDTLGLLDVADLRVEDLSYGHRKLIDIGRALCGEPALLLLDEPTSGLDDREQARLAEILREFHSSRPSLTILIVEHHMPLVRDVASRVIALQTGRIVIDGEMEEAMASPEFRAALMGHELTTGKD